MIIRECAKIGYKKLASLDVRKRGRHRRRWQQDVVGDLRKMNERCEEKARNIDDRRQIVNEAKVQIRLWCQG